MFDLMIYIISFIFVIFILVFVHEFGHYYIAKLCKVKIEKFSIGMGSVLFSKKDKAGTIWCISSIPLGGYVKMFGDANEASSPDFDLLNKMPESDKQVSFHHKNIYQKLAIVIAGPLANYLFAIILFASLAYFSGIIQVLPKVSMVMDASPAKQAGIMPGDEIVMIDDNKINEFSDIQAFIALHNSTKPIKLQINREGKIIDLDILPQMRENEDAFGDKRAMPYLGVGAGEYSLQQPTIVNSLLYGVRESYNLSKMTLQALGQIITGSRSVREIGGPISIAKYSGKTMQMGPRAIIWFLALLSVNLGLMNLLPIPMLDGGHVLFYLIEIISGKSLKKSIQEYGLKVGLLILGSLMIFATINDLVRLIWK